MEFHAFGERFIYQNDPDGFSMPYTKAGKLDLENQLDKYNRLRDVSRGCHIRLISVVYGGLKARR